MSYLRYLCLLGSSLSPVVCRKADVLMFSTIHGTVNVGVLYYKIGTILSALCNS